MELNNNSKHIDLVQMLKDLYSRKKLFFTVWGITFVLSSLFILCFPRYYTTTTRLAPEMGSMDGGGALSNLASSFGFNLGEIQSSDAIYPTLYPDLMEDNAFVTQMFNVRVRTLDGTIDTDYYTYLRKHQKSTWWAKGMNWVKNLFKSKDSKGNGEQEFNPYQLSKQDDDVANAIRGNIMFSYNEKTGVVSITTKAQDPLVCKTLADTVQVYLQNYITEYRTKKARVDVEHYGKLCEESLKEYNQARQTYAAYADANINARQQNIATKISDLENSMQMKYNNYTAYSSQLQLAYSKVQERTPAFTILKGAEVPIRPAGPKRMIFVAVMLILSTMVCTAVVLRKDLKKIIVIKG